MLNNDTLELTSSEWVNIADEDQYYSMQNLSTGVILIKNSSVEPVSITGAFKVNPMEVMSSVFLPGKVWVRALDLTRTISYSNYPSFKSLKNNRNLGFDAWGRNKAITDFSLFHGMFTFNVPKEMWIIKENGTEIYDDSSTGATSKNGYLLLKSIGTNTILSSKRHPRYQPNRGHLYSSSIFLPAPELDGIREFGIGTSESGVFFRLKKNGLLYAVARTKIDSVVVEDERLIDTQGIDLTKGNIYDIQMQWRGVGDFVFFVNQEPVVIFDYLGTRDNLSVFNPALPIHFMAKKIVDDVELKCGCVDITSEGGNDEKQQYASIASPEIATNTTEIPIASIYIPLLTPNGDINTRDVILSEISAYCTADAILRVYLGRRPDAINITYTDVNGGFQKSALNGAIASFNKSLIKEILSTRIAANVTAKFDNPVKNSMFSLTNGDYVIATIQGKNNSFGGCTITYGQEI